jgi:hypothetical protein
MVGAARPVAQEDADCRPHSDRQLAVPGLLDGAGGGDAGQLAIRIQVDEEINLPRLKRRPRTGRSAHWGEDAESLRPS